jgi:hypothetical protein
LTTYEVYAVLFAILQLLVSGLGFIVVAWTLRVLIRSIDAQSSSGVATRQLEFDKVILTYPCLYKYFYQGHDISSDDPEYPRAMAATQLLANYFDGYFQQRGMYRQMWPDNKWKSYIHDHVAKSPVLRRYIVENQNWFSPEFVQMCQSVGAQP